MRILICSDGMPASGPATRVGGLLANACRADTVLLGIAEKPEDERPLREALEKEAQSLQASGITPTVTVLAGDPIRQILNETSTNSYDLVIIGAQRKRNSGLYWRSEKTYEVIKAIAPPVLVAIGQCEQLNRFLVCTGGREFIEDAVQLTGKFAAALGATVTLLHVMAEPPGMYADLMQLEEDLDRLLESRSELGLNLRKQKESLERLGVTVEVRIRHGIVVDEVFDEARKGEHNLIVTGSSQGRGMVQHYIMGNLTRSILNRANCPVLVARSKGAQGRGIWQILKRAFGPTPE
jgi:nucleotide-binding universal stress UspA family protein